MKKNRKKMSTADHNSDVTAQTTIEEIENFLRSKYMFRYNEVTGKIFFSEADEETEEEVTDYFVNSVVRAMKKLQIKCNTTMVRELLNSEFTPKYNPFHDYFDELHEWDGKTDHIAELARKVKTTNDELFILCFEKWLVGVVAGLLVDEAVNHTVMILSGEQGIGKTLFFQSLIPRQLKKYQFSGNINPNNKDTLIHLAESMMINMDELENLTRTEIGALKAIITQPSINLRRPYGRNTETLPHRASFCGSVNGNQFLSDTTGSRRFLCFEAVEIDYNHGYDMDLVFAQALTLFKEGFKYWFGPDEIKLINANNEQFRHSSIEEDILLSYYEPCDLDHPSAVHMATTGLLQELSIVNDSIKVTSASKYAMGKALKANKFVRYKKNGVYGYAVKKKDARKNEVNNYVEVLKSYQSKAVA